jgi:DNA polymerase-1
MLAFPGVITYQQMITLAHSKKGYVQNGYGRRYYLKDARKAYKLANYVIQGTDADLLKACIIEIDKFLADKESKFVMNIHDELSFYVKHGEEWIIPKLKGIMEKHDWHFTPIISDIEITKTNWREKKDYELPDMS